MKRILSYSDVSTLNLSKHHLKFVMYWTRYKAFFSSSPAFHIMWIQVKFSGPLMLIQRLHSGIPCQDSSTHSSRSHLEPSEDNGFCPPILTLYSRWMEHYCICWSLLYWVIILQTSMLLVMVITGLIVTFSLWPINIFSVPVPYLASLGPMTSSLTTKYIKSFFTDVTVLFF